MLVAGLIGQAYGEKHAIDNSLKVEFCIADIKYNDQGLKILEFGSGPRSGFDGFDNWFGYGTTWNLFWTYLAQFNQPMWYLKTPKGEQWKKFIATETLYRLNGKFARDAEEVEKLIAPLYPTLSEVYPDYQGIFLINKHNKEYFPLYEQLRKKLPHATFVNAVASDFVFNKAKSEKLFRDYELRQYRPKSIICFKKYRPDLTRKIINTLRSEIFVIKPLNAQYGKGIIFVKKHELDGMLQCILNQEKELIPEKAAQLRIPLTEGVSYWKNDSNSRFLVEEYVPSKLVSIQGKRYDATLRAIFTMHCNNRKITITVLGAYWKLPSLAVDDEGSLNEIHQSYQYDRDIISAPVDPIDMEQIRKMLIPCLTKVYAKMLQKSNNEKSN